METQEDQLNEFVIYTVQIYAFASLSGISVFIFSYIFFKQAIKASKNLHNGMIAKVLNAPINLFFDVTPTGTILNRFSKDLTVLDEEIFYKFHELNLILGLLSTTILLVIVSNWLILLFLPFILFVCYSLFQKFVPAYRQCTRIESVTKSPILN